MPWRLTYRRVSLTVNVKAAQKLGMQIPKSILEMATTRSGFSGALEAKAKRSLGLTGAMPRGYACWMTDDGLGKWEAPGGSGKMELGVP